LGEKRKTAAVGGTSGGKKKTRGPNFLHSGTFSDSFKFIGRAQGIGVWGPGGSRDSQIQMTDQVVTPIRIKEIRKTQYLFFEMER